MRILDRIFRKTSSDPKGEAIQLINRAFNLVESGDFKKAIELLQKATELDPSNGHAYNELSFITGGLRHFDISEKYARKAIECDQENPKFRNTLHSIQLEKLKSLGSREAITELSRQIMQSLDRCISRNPDYTSYHLTRAQLIAASGNTENEWNKELKIAEDMYSKSNYLGTGTPASPDKIRSIIGGIRRQCNVLQLKWTNME
jgi:tetratricopeptide (TPR) repeat protein